MSLDLVKLNRLQQINLSTYHLHSQVFPQFRRIHKNQNIFLIASGVSANKIVNKTNIINEPNNIFIGVNRSFQIGNGFFPMNYIFIQDYSGKTKEYIDALNNYKPNYCIKFYGLTTEWKYEPERTIPESHAIKAKAYRYRTDWVNIPNFEPQFTYDIATQPLGCFGSIVFPALQFALWTYPKRIYLIGCDCTTSGYAYAKDDKNFLIPDNIIGAYKKFKAFATKYYPDIEIISINPVGLKGIFKDIETEE